MEIYTAYIQSKYDSNCKTAIELGNYKTKERAKEEIENFLKTCTHPENIRGYINIIEVED